MRRLPDRRCVWPYVLTLGLTFAIYIYVTSPSSVPFKKQEACLPRLKSNTAQQMLEALSNCSQEHEDSTSASELQSKRSHNEILNTSGNATIKEELLPWWDGGECVCKSEGDRCVPLVPTLETSLPQRLDGVPGTCGRRASADGEGQRVISLSLYGDDPGYWTGLSDTLTKVQEWYPGWKVWLYTDPRGRSEILCPLLRKHSNIRVCDVTNLPKPLKNISQVHPMMWRVSPLGDPMVDILSVRDADYIFLKRDKTAVQEWLDSGKRFHVMRDHPGHGIEILGGMWDARWDNASYPSGESMRRRPLPTPTELLVIRNTMFVASYDKTEKGFDQTILVKFLWPKMVRSLIAHDSFHCRQYPQGWKPWPTQRQNGTFVGNPAYRSKFSGVTLNVMCPPACRHPKHKDWIYC